MLKTINEEIIPSRKAGIYKPHWITCLAILLNCYGVSLCSFSTTSCCLAQAPPAAQVNFSRENTARVGSLVFDNGQPGGTCFYCDSRGYVATCFSNIHEARSLAVQFDAKTRIPIAGFVAASRGFDVVILQLLDPPDNDERFKRSLEQRPDFIPSVGNELVAWGGPLATAAATSTSLPRVQHVLRGDELVLGLKDVTSQSLGTRPDSFWMWLSQPRHVSCNGAPVFNQAGHTVGMLSSGPSKSSEIFSAIHIQHVVDLIPKDDPKPKPIKLLKTWTDPLAIEQPVTGRHATDPVGNIGSTLGGNLEAGQPLAARFTSLMNRLVRAKAERETIEKGMTLKQEKQTSILADIEKFQTEINAVQPEEPYIDTITVMEPRRETTTRTVRGPDGKSREVTETETVMVRVSRRVTRFKHSARQLEMLAPVTNQLRRAQANLEANKVQFDYETNVRLPFVVEAANKMEADFFFCADPLALRPRAEHVAFEEALTSVIDNGDATANIYLARGITRIQLARYKDALADLKEANDIDTKLRPLCRALHARMQGLESSHDKAMTVIKQLLREDRENIELLTVAARIEMDNQSSPGAARYLQQALQVEPDCLELQAAIAWLMTQGTSNSKVAMDMATSAATRTGFRDWNSLAALANVYMLRRQKDKALELISAAQRQAPDTAQEWCKRWQQTIESDKPIERKWN